MRATIDQQIDRNIEKSRFILGKTGDSAVSRKRGDIREIYKRSTDKQKLT